MYKALIFDIDGTAVPLAQKALPSKRLIQAIKKAQNSVSICAATGRPLIYARDVLNALSVTDPCIISGGAQIINPKTEKVLWEKRIAETHVKEIINTCIPYSYEILFDDGIRGFLAKDKVVSGDESIVYVIATKKADVKEIREKVEKIDEITTHVSGSWTKGCFDIQITHRFATKKHAIEKLLELLNVRKNNSIGVGDGDNDLPLFESVGLKVAMGNASDTLKSYADYIVPSVDEDGLATVIDTFLLKHG